MNDLYKALFASLLSFTVAIITYRYQFRRNRMVDFKGRMRLLHSLIKETMGLTEHAMSSVVELTESLKANNLHMPLLAVSAYPVAKYLQEKVLSDDYYIAYVNAYAGAIESEKYFFELKYSTVYLHTQWEQIVTMAQDAYLRDNERRKDFIERHQKANEIIQSAYDSKEASVHAYLREIEKIGYDFVTTREDDDGFGNIDEVAKLFVIPILELFAKDSALHKDLLPVMLHLNGMYYLFQNITKQNDNIRVELSELMQPMSDNLALIRKAYNYLSEQQLMNLIT